MAGEGTKRIIDLTEAAETQSGDYIAIDSTGRGTRKLPAGFMATAEDLSEEQTARQTADATLDGKITAEAQARLDADNALGDQITALDEKTEADAALIQNPTKTLSGALVSFTDGAEMPMVACAASIAPKQSGTGTPSPSNVRQISGWESVNLFDAGVNVWDEEWRLGYYNGSNGEHVYNSSQICNTNPISVKPSTAYYLKTPSNLRMVFYRADMSFISATIKGSGVFNTPDDCGFVGFNTFQNPPYPSGATYGNDISINYPSTDHDYHAYNGTTTTVNLGRTVYGGTLDVVSGVLTAYPFYPSYNGETLGGRWICDRAVYAEGTTPPTGSQVALISGTGTTYQLTPTEVSTLLGENNVWADAGQVEVRIADSIYEGYVLTEMPLTATATGAGEGGQTTYSVVRDGSYYLDRPDEDTFNGHDGETVTLTSVAGEGEAVITPTDLIGPFDDGTHYNLIATISDGIGQSAETVVPFEVRWAHQALVPTATAVTDTDALITKITPVAPAGTEVGDYCDIYRLSADKPELIVTGAQFGQTYVDPYPAIGDMGGHRVVFRTANGDYITEDNELAWVDLGFDDGDNLDINYSLIDFNGVQIPIRYNMDVENTWSKDFQETQYLGGSVQGDWNPAVSRTGGLNAVCETDDYDVIQAVRRLAVHPGICHVRTVDGSSYKADVQVKDSYSYSNAGKIASFSLSITRVDPEYLDGMTLEQWEA